MGAKTFKFDIGTTLRDKVTGFEGVCIARGDHVSGCDTYGVQSTQLKDGLPQDLKWFDEPRVEQVGTARLSIDERAVRTGADSTIPTASRSVGR